MTVATPKANPQNTERALVVLPLMSSGNDEDLLLASSLADLLRDRLARFAGLTVISNRSAASLGAVADDAQAAGRKLHVQFVLHGNIERHEDQLQIALQLTDAQTGKQLWADNFVRPASELAAVREETAVQVARVLHLPAGGTVPASPINLEAYQLYVRGQRLMSNLRQADAEQAAALFQRATVLDPDFARAYLANGQALLLANRVVSPETPELEARIEKRYERALELDPTLGEVWIERARMLPDQNRAEELYRKGLAISPNFGMGYMRYSELLMSQGRLGEAIEMIDRARRIDPMTPHLHTRKATMLFLQHSDVAASEALLREALEINPDFQVALLILAESRYAWSGEFAEGVRLAERAIVLDPDDDSARASAASMYLDLDDPQAAEHVLRGVRVRSDADVELAEYRRDVRRAAEIAYGLDDANWTSGPFSPLGEAICDAAAQSGDYARALQTLESKYATGKGPVLRRRGVTIVYAVALKLTGDSERSSRVAKNLLVALTAEEVGRPKDWFSRERAATFAVLGDDVKAMELLEASQRMKQFGRWWYTGELDPLYAHLHSDPRFKALVERAKQHRAQQRALLEEMRNKGVVPRRTG
jgi:TolB-like protein/predicted Zn-dependent protease